MALPPMPTDSDQLTVVHIVTSPYSGCTWLGLMLGAHPAIFTVGEMRRIAHDGQAVCNVHRDGCPVWSRFDLNSDENPFFQLNRLTGKRVFVVKNAWPYLDAQHDPRIKSRFVELVRDGRAVTASRLRKNPGRSCWKAAREWRKKIRKNRRFLRTVPASARLTVLYERLVADKAAELQRLCDYIEVPYDPDMQQFWETDQHYIGGNGSTIFGMLNRRGEEKAAIQFQSGMAAGPEAAVEFYKQRDAAHFVDERWKHELTERQQRIFQYVAGRWNRAYGYPDMSELVATA